MPELTGITSQHPAIQSWEVGPSRFRVLPEYGARLMDWRIALPRSAERTVIYWPEDTGSVPLSEVRGGNPILFPFSGRCTHEGSGHRWKTPDGTVRDIPMHGIARQGRFQVVETDGSGFVAEFHPDDDALASYPFAHTFRVSYRFSELAFTATFTLENQDRLPIPWAAGHHFYFQLPWHPESGREHYRILVPSKHAVRLSRDGVLTRDPEYVPEALPADLSFADPAQINRIFMKWRSGIIRFGPRNGEEDVVVQIGEGGKPSPIVSLVTWTESPESPFYCVEPWMGPPNAPGTGKVHWVRPGATAAFDVTVRLA